MLAHPWGNALRILSHFWWVEPDPQKPLITGQSSPPPGVDPNSLRGYPSPVHDGAGPAGPQLPKHCRPMPNTVGISPSWGRLCASAGLSGRSTPSATYTVTASTALQPLVW